MKKMTRSSDLDRLNRLKLDGRGRRETVGEEDQVGARSGSGGDEETLEAGLTGQASECLGRRPVRSNKVLAPQTEPLEDGVIREIQDPLELDRNGYEHEGTECPTSGCLADFRYAGSRPFTAVKCPEGVLRIVAATVKYTPPALRARSRRCPGRMR